MFVHGHNLKEKEYHSEGKKYSDNESKRLLKEIRKKYDVWHKANNELKGPFSKPCDNDIEIIKQRVEMFAVYKDFIDQKKYAEKFDSRSNLHSTVLEEFIYYLFRDLVLDFSNDVLIGKSHTFKDIFFKPPKFTDMVSKPYAKIETKDHDFVIGVNINASLNCRGIERDEMHSFDIPAVAIECKTYLDKTMLEGASTAAEQLKLRNPNALYIVVMEWIKLTRDINLKKYKVDQIYIFRKQKNTDREFRFLDSYQKNPIYDDVVWHLFECVRSHLTADWESGIEFGLKKGFLI